MLFEDERRADGEPPIPASFLIPGERALPEVALGRLGADPGKPVRAWAYDGATTILRQSIATHFEAPFLKLLVGKKRVLLVDSGTGDADVRGAVDAALEVLAASHLDLVVAHTHAHSDHVGGDRQFAGRPRTTIVGHTPADVVNAFGIGGHGRGCERGPDSGSIDLGDRPIDVVFIPGHEAAHVAFYDRATRLLLTGDTLYPGRLYVRDWPAYCASIARLVRFVDTHPVEHVLGAHIELSAANVEYPEGALAHPDEHPLPLGESHLRDLLSTVDRMATAPTRTARPSYVVVPLA
jgi:glyoxylase-like metal-dependent hydrolase (beta-lactamase superfamily II)